MGISLSPSRTSLPANEILAAHGIFALYLVLGGTHKERLGKCQKLNEQTLLPRAPDKKQTFLPWAFQYDDAIAFLLLENFEFARLGLDVDKSSIRQIAETRSSDRLPYITVIDLDRGV